MGFRRPKRWGGCPGTSYALVANVLRAGESLTVAVSRAGKTWKTWERVGKDWKELNQVEFNSGPQVNWSNMLESLPASVGSIPGAQHQGLCSLKRPPGTSGGLVGWRTRADRPQRGRAGPLRSSTAVDLAGRCCKLQLAHYGR